MTPVTIPRPLMWAIDCDWDIDWRGQSAGQSNAGTSQVVYNRFPVWVGSPTLALYDRLIDYWRAVRMTAQGRATPFRVPMMDRRRGNGPEEVPFSNDVPMTTGHGFAYRPAAVCVVAAAAGATELLMNERDEPIEIGQFMSHNDWPFLVTWKDQAEENVRVGIQMPLRRAIPAGAEVMLRASGMFLATDDTMGNPTFVGGVPFSQPQLSFIEWIDRP